MEPWVFFDVGNLIWRAYHTTGKKGLSHGGVPTGVTFGFLREVRLQLDRHQTDNAVFCFDSKKESVRKKQFPGYKAKRHGQEYTPEQEAEYKLVQKQIRLIKSDYLPELEFVNLLEYDGFEADDAIGMGVLALRQMSYAVGDDIEGHIVSSDKDMLQLLAYPGVTCWTAGVEGKATTKETFELQWGLNPAMWQTIKALAGCSTDEIPGIDGVGEKTAASYLRKGLSGEEYTTKELLCRDFMLTDRWKRNMDLVQVPHRELRRSSEMGDLQHQPPVAPRAWNKLYKKLGIKTIA